MEQMLGSPFVSYMCSGLFIWELGKVSSSGCPPFQEQPSLGILYVRCTTAPAGG